MATSQPGGDFRMFRDTLAELERLIDIRDKLLDDAHTTKMIGESILHMLNLLTEFDVNTSESNAIEELELLTTMKLKTIIQCQTFPPKGVKYGVEHHLDYGQVFDKLIDSKIDFLQEVYYSHVRNRGGLEPISALERLTEIYTKVYSKRMDHLLGFKIHEVAWRPRPKLSTESATASVHASSISSHIEGNIIDRVPKAFEKQENPKPDLPNKCEGSKTVANFMSSPVSWIQNQGEVLAKIDDGSTTEGGELTPTSTIMSEEPDFTNGGELNSNSTVMSPEPGSETGSY